MGISAREGGYTIIELIIVIGIIIIMAAIVVFAPQDFQEQADAQEQTDDIASIARRLETAYSAQDIGAPSYPSTVELLADISGKTRTMSRTNAEIFSAPGVSASSVIAATNVDTYAPAGGTSPSKTQYVYQPINTAGTLCTASPSATTAANRCVKFNLYYRDMLKGEVIRVKSLHQQ